MYLWWSLCTLYLHACQVRVIIGESGLCCTCVTYFERWLTPLNVEFDEVWEKMSIKVTSSWSLSQSWRRWWDALVLWHEDDLASDDCGQNCDDRMTMNRATMSWWCQSAHAHAYGDRGRVTNIQVSTLRYLLGQKHNLQIFGVIPFVKLQNDT